MIGESSNISTLINSERISRENQIRPGGGQEEEDSLQQSFADVASFSPQALALARKVAPTGASAEQEQTQSQGRQQGAGSGLSARLLDIRI